jgi:hypothetical protein
MNFEFMSTRSETSALIRNVEKQRTLLLGNTLGTNFTRDTASLGNSDRMEKLGFSTETYISA